MANEVEVHVRVHRAGNLNVIGEDLKRHYRKIGGDIRRQFDEDGRNSGRRFVMSMIRSFGEATAGAARVAADFGNGIARALSRNPMIAAGVGAAIIAAVMAVLPLIGAAIAGAVVLGLGAGLAGVGIAFAAKSSQIKAVWGNVFKEIGQEMTSISKPFEDTLSKTAEFIKRTFAALKPDLSAAFDFLGPSTTKFFDALGRSMEELGPAIQPVAQAFDAILKTLGGQFPGMMRDIADSITGVANSIKDNPETFVMLIGWLKNIITFTLDVSAGLNKIAGWFESIPGFGRAIEALGLALKAAFAPTVLLLEAIAKLGQTGGTKRAMKEVNQELHNTEEAAKAATKALKTYADEIRAQVDPLFAFGKAQREANKAQKAYNKAVKESGENSPEARKALENLMRATLALAGATTDAGGATGRLSSKQRALLRSMGMTEGQIKALERRLAQLRHQLFLTEIRAARAMRDRRAVYEIVFKYTGQRVAGVTGRGGFSETAHGGIIGAKGMAHGGISGSSHLSASGNFTLVGEEGPELVNLPFGSNVIPAGTTRNTLLQGGGGNGGRVVLEFARSGDRLIDALAEELFKYIRVRGGDVQVVLGNG